ncbi:LysR family transcriptional regulator [Roseateles saccharophilus]|uniref:DNA-binding transcriptional LysR family regulator n=1 Tax=Roseateles saccharophilus TaxID=304 RepID=A0A4R3UTK4_ROSSA|nr:LysR family transcriptional regulator [Roseateles saccharophilus]MDG0832718.1 LysR family transcriptional regulator [Roseateles saccharophilus]TCU95346.1 DNA-binding transcriptional LysR family regulator [Roseateles saccharophilus]
MSDFDHLDLDGHLLRLLLAVHEEGSITGAAQRLGVSQSAVSHLLEKLRRVVGDPLFVKSGRGIVATARADALVVRARLLLEELRTFGSPAGFEPAGLQMELSIAANDLQRDLLLPPLLRRLRAQAPGVSLRVIASGVPEPALLRDGHCQLLLTPRPPDASDLVHKRIFEDRYAVFHDPVYGQPPADLAAYLAAEHVTVLYEQPRRPLDLDQWLAAQGHRRRFAAQVPSFAAVAAFVSGGPWLATLPSWLGAHTLRGLASAPPPLACPTLPMYAVWHLRHQTDPLHQWLRRELEAVVPPALRAG